MAGFYIIGRYTSCAWFLHRDEAEKECARMNLAGGTNYHVEPSEKGNLWKPSASTGKLKWQRHTPKD